MKARAAGLGLALALAGTGVNLHAQEAEVADAIRSTLTAWTEGRFDDFAAYYHPEARGFYLDGGPLTGTFDAATMRAAYQAGFRADVVLRDLDVRVWGGAAVAAGYISGTLTLPGDVKVPGVWRYTETRVRDQGVWKVVQFHFSQQSPGLLGG